MNENVSRPFLCIYAKIATTAKVNDL